MKELDSVVLTEDVPQHGLREGDVGAIVMVHGEGKAFEIEFVAYDGHTVALLTLEARQVRSIHATEIPHVRELLAA
jgi:hypothetical protein